MSDRHDLEAGEADPVARLVRLAGARPPVPEERAARVENRVRAVSYTLLTLPTN